MSFKNVNSGLFVSQLHFFRTLELEFYIKMFIAKYLHKIR